MGRLEDYWENEVEDERLAEQSYDNEVQRQQDEVQRQKEEDLERALARNTARPIKKDSKHAKIDGRYILPDEVKIEVAKLEKAKQEALQKKQGFFSKLFGGVSQECIAETAIESKKQSEIQARKIKAEKIKELRGIREQELSSDTIDFDVDDLDFGDDNVQATLDDEEEKNYPDNLKGFSFSQSVSRLTGGHTQSSSSFFQERPEVLTVNEVDVADLSDETVYNQNRFSPVNDVHDGPIASALSVAAGFIYWDEENRLVDRVITIRRLFARQGDILIDAFCHDILAPRLISFSKGVELYNIQTMKPYENPRDFLLYRVAGMDSSGQFSNSSFMAVLSEVRYELTALSFVARADCNKSVDENYLMLTYVSRRCADIPFDEDEMLEYISILVPDEQSFFEALDIIVRQPEEIVVLFAQTFVQMLLSDGVLHEKERELLAELLYVLRLEGIDLRMIGLQ